MASTVEKAYRRQKANIREQGLDYDNEIRKMDKLADSFADPSGDPAVEHLVTREGPKHHYTEEGSNRLLP